MLKGIYGVLIGMLIILLVMFGSLFINSKSQTKQEAKVENPEYHIQLIVQDSSENFWTSFREGAKAAEEELGVYVEFVAIKQLDVDSLREAVEVGVNSGVEAIALQAADSEQTQQIINNAKDQGVQIITYENNNYIVADTPMVGTNNYSLGSYAGDMAVEASVGKGNVAVIINSPGTDGAEEYKNLIIQGINNSFGSYGKIETSYLSIYTIDADMFEAEKVTSEILASNNIPDLIICMDEKCTPGIAQILVDKNMVGDIKLVGYGVTTKTLEYIQHGVIYGTVCPDSYEIGYKTVQSLVQMLNGDAVSEAISTGLYTIDKSNVQQYVEDKQEQ
jgi:ribose transport system substrate-binding protein